MPIILFVVLLTLSGHAKQAVPSIAQMKHMEEIRDCVLCHTGDNPWRDKTQLHMLDGEPFKSKAIAELCSQCHGINYRDWKNGIHGKKSDCIECHEPHNPTFKPMKAVAPPVIPRFGQNSAEKSSKNSESKNDKN